MTRRASRLGSAMHASAPRSLPDTAFLTTTGDLAARMVDGIHAYLDRQLAAAPKTRQVMWEAENLSAAEATKFVAARRDDLRQIVGVIDDRIEPSLNFEVPHPQTPLEIGRGSSFAIYEVRWTVLDGLDAEGLLLTPDAHPNAHIIAVPDADTSPEQLAGISDGLTPDAQTARRLTESGCQVLVPDLIDRSDRWSQTAGVAETNQPHREFIYRMAYQIGRHIVGYEVQKILAAVDWFARNSGDEVAKIGVAGHGEGGLLALYAAAIDDRIAGALVSGYFESRERIWREPIYRNVWSLLTKFGDAELAAMIAPRSLTVASGDGPEVDGPPPLRDLMRKAAPGRLTGEDEEAVNNEAERAANYFRRFEAEGQMQFVPENASGPRRKEALEAFLAGLGVDADFGRELADPMTSRAFVGRSTRLHRQFQGLVQLVQSQVRAAENNRQAYYWASTSHESIDAWSKSRKVLRDQFWIDVIGKLPKPTIPPNPRTRLAYERDSWNGYELTLDLWPDVFAYGTLLIPKGIHDGERRPVVVCQHGLEGRTQDVVDKSIKSVYHGYGEQLVERGFVVLAPQQPHIFEDHFRTIQRKANPLGLTLFSFIVRQHERFLEWLGTLPYVDPERIGFYGLSYGGFTGMRIPAILDGYCLSICSANFNDWLWKTTSVDSAYSYMFTREFEIPEFDQGNTFGYAEMAGLIAPRPFMVERGHDDGVAPDERVAFEYAKVSRMYAKLGIPERTEIEYFDGGHEVHAQGTFDFLHKHLDWPGPGN